MTAESKAYAKEVKKKSKLLAQKFGLQWGLSPKALKIIRLLGEGKNQAEIAKKLRVNKQNIHYYTNKAISHGLIKERLTVKIVHNRESKERIPIYPRVYDLTALGQTFLTGSERGVMPEPCTLESYAMKFALLADNSHFSWAKVGDPNHWVKLGIKLGDVTVEKNLGLQPTVIIRVGQLAGYNSEHLFAQAGGIIMMVWAILKDRGVELSQYGVPVGDPNVKMYTPEAIKLHEQFGNLQTPSALIDNSPPDKIPHEERNRRQQQNYLSMADRVAHIEAMVADVLQRQAQIVQAQEALASASQQLTNIVQEQTTLQRQQQEILNRLFNLQQPAEQPNGKSAEKLSSLYE